MTDLFSFSAKGKPLNPPDAPAQLALTIDDAPEMPPELPEAIRTRVTAERVNYIVDAAMNAHRAKYELSRMVSKRDALLTKLRDPALFEHPKRIDAVVKHAELEAAALNLTCDLIEAETEAHFFWRKIRPELRAGEPCAIACRAWDVEPDTPSLLGRSWQLWHDDAPLPKDFVISRELIPYLSWDAVLAYNAAGLLGSEPMLTREEHAQRKRVILWSHTRRCQR